MWLWLGRWFIHTKNLAATELLKFCNFWVERLCDFAFCWSLKRWDSFNFPCFIRTFPLYSHLGTRIRLSQFKQMHWKLNFSSFHMLFTPYINVSHKGRDMEACQNYLSMQISTKPLRCKISSKSCESDNQLCMHNE